MENNSKNPNKPAFMLIALVLVILAGVGGYWVGMMKKPATISYLAPTDQSGSGSWPASIVTSQDATGVGKIVKVENKLLTLEGSDGKQAAFTLDPSVNIYSPVASTSGQIKPSQNLNDLTVGKKVAVSLHLINKVYYVTSVTLLAQ